MPGARDFGLVRRFGREIGRLLRDVLPVVLVAFLVFQLIRTRLLERYLVPSGSMEPTLHGDPTHGDLVLVDKTAFWRRPLRRFCMVVLHNPDDPEGGLLVKRVVAWGDDVSGGEFVRIRDGDLFVGRDPNHLERLVKDPLAMRAMRVTHFAFPNPLESRAVTDYFRPDPVWKWTGDRLRLRPAGPDLASLGAVLLPASRRARRARRPAEDYLPGHLSTRRPVDASFIDGAGRIHESWGLFPDIGMELQLVCEPRWTGLQMVFEYAGHYFAFTHTQDGRSAFTRDGVRLETASGVAPRARISLAFGYLDGSFFFIVDGREIFHLPLELPTEPEETSRPVMHDLLHLAIAGASAEIERLRVFHDVHYKSLLAGPQGSSELLARVDPGQLWLLGDNTLASRDSRMHGPYSQADLVGRPLAIIGPPARMRWLIR